MDSTSTGMVTFLFTDIEGSTVRWERDPDAMLLALQRHDGLLRDTIEAAGGRIFHTVGDAFCAAFDAADPALEAAIASQRNIQSEEWERFGEAIAPLRVRMALHSGTATQRGTDYVGPPLNRVARLEAAAHGGQILLSDAAREQLSGAESPKISLRDLGEHRLRDLRTSERIWQVVVEGITDVRRRLRTAGTLEARDRILVVDPDPVGGADRSPESDTRAVLTRSEDEILTVLEQAVTGRLPHVTLTTDQVRTAARHAPADLDAYRLSRIAAWSDPRYRLDGRFVELTLRLEADEQGASEATYDDLRHLLRDVRAPVMSLLGPPGAGKSTLLRRLEYDLAVDGLRGERAPFTILLPLDRYGAAPGAPPEPGRWMAARWSALRPNLPPLETLLAQSDVVLLLDGLDELPAPDPRERRARIRRWKDWLRTLAEQHPGTRVIVSCREGDYDVPLGTPDLPVPVVRVEPLSDFQVRDFLKLHSPLHWRGTWEAVARARQLEVLRSPFFLKLLTDRLEQEEGAPVGAAALTTRYLRSALRREVERDHPLFRSGGALIDRDRRRLARGLWASPWDLPTGGPLVSALTALAQAKLRAGARHGAVSSLPYEEAITILETEVAAGGANTVLRAAIAVGVLEEDLASDGLRFAHPLLRAYFAGRRMAERPEATLELGPWRLDPRDQDLDLGEVVADLAPSEALPPLAGTAWDDALTMAAEMSDDPDTLVRAVSVDRPDLAGRIAARPGVLERLGETTVRDLRNILVSRLHDPSADPRSRIAAGLALGPLGNPCLGEGIGPDGHPYLLPSTAKIPTTKALLGDDAPIAYLDRQLEAHVPAHSLTLSGFRMAVAPLSNAEWACFMAAGGYEDERWWHGPVAAAWRRGEGTAAGPRADVRYWLAYYRERPDYLEHMRRRGLWDAEEEALWLSRLAMSPGDLGDHLRALFPDKRRTEPRFWRDPRYANPAQPVVGISWFEARAYAAWLSAQTGKRWRLPTEAEWELAARGAEGRIWPWGEAYEPWRANTAETRLRRPTPAGAFPAGDTPEGLCDMAGNVLEWTVSAWGERPYPPDIGYPYDPADGRECVDTYGRRVVRGGAWCFLSPVAVPFHRGGPFPDDRIAGRGARLVLESKEGMRPSR